MKRILLAALIWLAPLCGALAQVTGVSPAQMFGCNKAVVINNISGSNKAVAGLGTLGTGLQPQIYVCGFTFMPAGSSASFSLFWDTVGSACAGSNGTVVPTVLGNTNLNPIVDSYPLYRGLAPVPNGQDLCASLAGSGSVLVIYYTQF